MVFDRDDGRAFFFDRGGLGGGLWRVAGFVPDALPFLTTSLVFFGYWTYFEYTRGQSIGKMVMRQDYRPIWQQTEAEECNAWKLWQVVPSCNRHSVGGGYSPMRSGSGYSIEQAI